VEKYKLLIFPAAKRDLQEIIDYINEQSSFEDYTLYDEMKLPLRLHRWSARPVSQHNKLRIEVPAEFRQG